MPSHKLALHGFALLLRLTMSHLQLADVLFVWTHKFVTSSSALYGIACLLLQ